MNSNDRAARVLLPMIRRMMPNIIAQDLIGVQPMVGQSWYDQLGLMETETLLGKAGQVGGNMGSIFKLRARYGS